MVNNEKLRVIEEYIGKQLRAKRIKALEQTPEWKSQVGSVSRVKWF